MGGGFSWVFFPKQIQDRLCHQFCHSITMMGGVNRGGTNGGSWRYFFRVQDMAEISHVNFRKIRKLVEISRCQIALRSSDHVPACAQRFIPNKGLLPFLLTTPEAKLQQCDLANAHVSLSIESHITTPRKTFQIPTHPPSAHHSRTHIENHKLLRQRT